jgi:hypothetical protein
MRTVNQTAGIAVNAAAVQPGHSEPRSLPCDLITWSMTTTDGQHNTPVVAMHRPHTMVAFALSAKACSEPRWAAQVTSSVVCRDMIGMNLPPPPQVAALQAFYNL